MTSANIVKNLLRPGLIRTGLLGLLAPICFLPAGQAQAVTFSRDPVADGWSLVGNSITQGNWVNKGLGADFNIYSYGFKLGAYDSVSGSGFGDAYLYRPSPTDPSWQVGDKILGLGLKFNSGQGRSAANGTIFFNWDPQPKPGTTFTPGTVSGLSPGQWDFFQGGSGPVQNGSSAGSLNFSILTADTASNQGPYGNTYNVKTSPGGSGTNTAPYGIGIASTPNISTTGSSALGTAPMRVFSNGNATSGVWDYYQIFLNESLMQRNGFGEATFTNFGRWSIQAVSSAGAETMATGGIARDDLWGVPGPLPLLGAGAALGWSRQLRRRVKASGSPAAKSSS